jgi:hypothetical protein
MVKITTRSYLLYGAALGALIIILIALILNSSDNSLFLLGQNNNNKQQPNGKQGEEDDEYYPRGAVNSTSGEGKQVVEKYEKYLCGESSEKKYRVRSRILYTSNSLFTACGYSSRG